jgi:glycosyltransferase involved in cell wall biosynthesis
MTAHETKPELALPRIALVTAPADEGLTAIGDYTRLLCERLRAVGVDAVHLQHDEWGFGGLKRLLQRIEDLRPSLVHIQHPQGAYGRSLGPQLLSLLRPAVVTLHEASRYGPVRGRARLLPFLARSRRVVVTSEFERRYVAAFAPWARRRLRVIPLASNIPAAPGRGVPAARRLVYFGSIRPDKGLETFLRVAERLAAEPQNLECAVIGNPVPTSVEYAQCLRAGHSACDLQWLSGLAAVEVSAELAGARVAYLPFPDGASERRGSLLATLGCGLPTVSTAGRHTTPALRRAIVPVSTEAEAVATIATLINDDAAWEQSSRRARDYASRFTWDAIVQSHLALYREAALR